MSRPKKSSATNTTTKLVIFLVILLLGALGIQVPDQLQELFPFTIEETKPTVEETPAIGNNPGPEELGSATFTAEELADKKTGWISYHALDDLGRATGADALLKPAMVGTGTSANQTIRPTGFVSGLEPHLHSRGHLIGRQLGGTGDDMRNLVTLYQTPVNTPYMTKYENQIRQALDQGATIRYRVTPIYEGENLLCTKIELEAQSITPSIPLNFRVSILNLR